MTDPATAAGRWASVHAFHHGDQDTLVTEAVAPVAAKLVAGGHAHRWFFLRYWDGGPHVRVRVDADPDHAGAVEATLLDELGAWLRDHPSTPRMDAAAYTAMAAELARQEQLDGYEPALRPNDTAAVVGYRPEHDAYGYGTALAAVERHFTESSAIALEALTAGIPAGRRRGLALSAGLVTLAVADPDLERIAARFAADTERIRTDGERAGVPPGLSGAYDAQRDRLLAQVEQVWALAGGGAPAGTGTVADRWLASIRALHDRLEAAADRGDLPAGEPRQSPMMWALEELPRVRRTVFGVLLRATHLLSNRLGVGIADELYVNYLISRALGDLGARPSPTPTPEKR